MANVIVTLIIIIILAISITKVVTEKKKGVKCIGCPHSKGCTSAKCETSINGIVLKK